MWPAQPLQWSARQNTRSPVQMKILPSSEKAPGLVVRRLRGGLLCRTIRHPDRLAAIRATTTLVVAPWCLTNRKSGWRDWLRCTG
jgi:hypothetical protein